MTGAGHGGRGPFRNAPVGRASFRQSPGISMKLALFFAAAVFCMFPAAADAGCRGCRPAGGFLLFAPVAVQPVVIQPQPIAVIQPPPVAVVPKTYATPLRDLLFGTTRIVPLVPVAPPCCVPQGTSVQPVE